MQRILFILLFLLLLSSCSTGYFCIPIDVKKVAPITLEQDAKRILIVDNSFMSDASVAVSVTGISDSLLKAVYDTLRFTLLDSFAQYLNAENIYDTVLVYPYYPKPLYLYNEAKDKAELPLTRNEIVELCQRTDADILISLDYAGVVTNLNKYAVNSPLIMNTRLDAVMRAYKNNGSIIKPIKMDYWIVDEVNDKEAVLKNNFIKSAQMIADSFVNCFAPRWVSQDRVYYLKGIPDSYASIVQRDKDKWLREVLRWKNAYEAEKKTKWKKKAKYASNTALAHEYSDDIESALKWINIACAELPGENNGSLAQQIRSYKKELEQRQKEAPLLWRQLKIEMK